MFRIILTVIPFQSIAGVEFHHEAIASLDLARDILNFVNSNNTRLLGRGSGLTEADKETWTGAIVAKEQMVRVFHPNAERNVVAAVGLFVVIGPLDRRRTRTVAFRKKWAEQSGFGFELPSVLPSVPKCTEKAETAVAA